MFPKHLGWVDCIVVDLYFVYSKTQSYILFDDLFTLSVQLSDLTVSEPKVELNTKLVDGVTFLFNMDLLIQQAFTIYILDYD